MSCSTLATILALFALSAPVNGLHRITPNPYSKEFWADVEMDPKAGVAKKQHIDKATKEKVAAILGSILDNLQKHKSLVEISQAVVHEGGLADSHSEGLRTALASVVVTLRGKQSRASLISMVSGRSVADKSAEDVVDVLASAVGNCPFGYGCHGGNGDMSEATKKKVAGILGGILKHLTNKRETNGLEQQDDDGVKRAVGSLISTMRVQSRSSKARDAMEELTGIKFGDERSAVSAAAALSDLLSGDKRPLTKKETDMLSNVLKGLITKLSNH